MMTLVFDNYDSFTYNIVQLVAELCGERPVVARNDRISLDEIDRFDSIILSPGPGIPEEAGLLLPLIERFAARKRIFGVCLGHQAIGQVFGGRLINLDSVYHGVASRISVFPGLGPGNFGNDWFLGLGPEQEVGRYHSWVVDEAAFPEALEVTAVDESGRVMALRHREYDLQGVQFHPESILTPKGKQMMANWLGLNPS